MILRVLDQAPSIKDLDIEKRFRELKNFNESRNNNNDDDDNDDKNKNLMNVIIKNGHNKTNKY